MDQNQAKATSDKVELLTSEVQRMHERFSAMEEQLNDLRTEVVILRATQNAPPPAPASALSYRLASPGFGSSATPGPPPAIPNQRPRGHSAHFIAGGPPHDMPRPSEVKNAHLLPFTLEAIAAESRRVKGPIGMQRCDGCQKPRGLPACFQARHFDWCVSHAKDIPVGYDHCDRGPACFVVHWEEVSNWDELVEYSKASGQLGNKGVRDLDKILFARD